jgi:cation diffusion facilitator CzcD-associated flavoprotein CzcO
VNGENGNQRQLSVGVVGAGFGGVGLGIKLRQAGIEEFTIFERGDSVGGTWRANTYPGLACDVPSHLYSFSFALGHEWSRRYAPQAEILRYLQDCADRFGLAPHLRFNTEVTGASFDAAEGRWTLTTDGGEEHSFDVLVTACGQLSRPTTPAIPGLEEFEGRAFHSAEWDHDHDLAGGRVAVVGTGASAIQFVPAIAPEVERLTIYQRSAPWILPKMDREYPAWERRLFRRLPARVLASRLGLFLAFEVGTYGFTTRRGIMKAMQRLADREREKALPDPELRAKATPDYAMGCKRVLISNDWYPTLTRPNVELLNGGVQRITAGGIVGSDGVERGADTIIFGTGFATTDFITPMAVHGLDGRELNETWAGRAEAFLGTTVSGFPNMFILYGPNTNHGAGSVPYLLECQFNYVLDAIRRVRENGFRWIDLRPEAQEQWRREMAERSAVTVWTEGGCTNWYLNAAGENTNNWVGPWLEFRRRTRRINPGHYRVAT